MAHARRALDLVGEDDHLGAGAAAGLLGLASWTSGDLEAAHRSYADGMASLEKAGHLSDVDRLRASPWPTSGSRRVASREAMRIFERGLALATGQGGPSLRGAADMHVGHERAVLRERNDLEAAPQHLLASQRAGRGERPAAEPATGRVSRWPGSGRPKGTSTARSSCSTRPSACT